MRTIVDIPDQTLPILDHYAKTHKLSRAAVIRKAIGLYLDNVSTDPDEAFGLWREREVDGVSYQENLRKEWD
ncbi:MAG: CopG family transcriptional regulator [Verrucomicrobia bacterium]|nr:CopG family transcriptional regulator [Verrucomicrobiota bacterium]